MHLTQSRFTVTIIVNHYFSLQSSQVISGHVNATFCVKYAYKSNCMQNHGLDACTVHKKWDSVSRLLKKTMTQMIKEHTRACERKACIICEDNFILLNLRCFWNASFISLFHFVGSHYWIFVWKFIIHLHTVYHLLNSERNHWVMEFSYRYST